MVALNTSGIIRTSVSSAGAPGNSSSYSAFASGDGRFVTFYSYADTLTSGDSNSSTDIFLRDTLTGTTHLVSTGYDGSPSNGGSYAYSPSVSDDGRFVTFYSYATNLVPGDTNGYSDVFVRDMQSGTTIRLSQASDGTQGNSDSYDPQITGDGRFVVFDSYAGNLVAGDINGTSDIFLRDLLTGQTTIVSRSTAGGQGDNASYDPDVSQDGRYVAFNSDAANLVAGDTNGTTDIFLRDTVNDTTVRVSVATGGTQGNDYSYDAQVSDDGRFVVFESNSNTLVASDANGTTDIFVRDTVANTTKLLSVSTGGVQGNSSSYDADVSADGRYVVFQSYATNLVAGDSNGAADIFLRDTVLNTTTRLSVGLGGVEANSYSADARITADGHFVTFDSAASNLVAGDTNGQVDTFRVSLFATNAADYLIGSDGADTILALGGADIVNGGLGADTMVGGTGNDTYFVDNGGDLINEAAGAANGTNDIVRASATYGLRATVAVERLETTDAAGTAAIYLAGNELAQTITGNNGVNILTGGGGNDTLSGKLGNDQFFFNAALNATTNVDVITDFANASGNNDLIRLENAVFTALTATGYLAAGAFQANASGQATQTDDRIILETDTGQLFYDANGSAVAGDGVQFATITNYASLTGAAALSATDFFVV